MVDILKVIRIDFLFLFVVFSLFSSSSSSTVSLEKSLCTSTIIITIQYSCFLVYFFNAVMWDNNNCFESLSVPESIFFYYYYYSLESA